MYVSQFYKGLFGCKIYKISLDAGCTCPTRDGTKGTRGCIFCSPSGSGDFAASRNLSVKDQIEQAKKLVENKNRGGSYLAYFQNFSSTYGETELLAAKYREALSSPGVAGLAVATRPDCISDDMLSCLAELSRKHFVQLELGLQTVNEETARYIRRGFETSEYERAVERIRKAAPGIHIVAHVIFGLPGETREDMMKTVERVVQTAHGIKISCLHVLKGTDLALDYAAGAFGALSEEEYYGLIQGALEIIPESFVIHRLTGDGPKSLLIAPLWTANKRKVHNELSRRFRVF